MSHGAWANFPALDDLFINNYLGVMPGRTWVIAPDAATLRERWSLLVREKSADRKETLFHPHLRGGKPGDKHLRKTIAKSLTGYPARLSAVINDTGPCIDPIRYAFRSFDRQWIIPDARLINQPSPKLWQMFSARQVHLTALEKAAPTSGPSVTFTGLIPDHDHYKGSFAGRVYPLWRDRSAKHPNIKPDLLAHLAKVYGTPVKAEDVMAYIAAIMAHPAFTARFSPDLVFPGLRAPLTADVSLFSEAVSLGSEVIWLHSYGERFVDPTANRPKHSPRLPKEGSPSIPASGAIPSAPEPLPDEMAYDPATHRLKIGQGYVENVTPEMWAYEVSGKQVIWHWFSYRQRNRTRSRNRGKASTIPAGLNTARKLVARIYDRPAGPVACPGPAHRAGAEAGGFIEPHLRGPIKECGGVARRRRIRNA